MLALLLAVQVAAATPTPAPTPPGGIPAAPRTLTDVARERRLGQRGATGGTFSIAGAPVQDPGPTQVAAAPVRPSNGVTPPPTPQTPADAAEARAEAARRNWRVAMNNFWDEADRKGTTSEALEPLRKKLDQAEKAMMAAEADAAKYGR